MTSVHRHIITEMAVIILVAVLLGTAWNHRTLCQVWTGQAAPTGTDRPAPTGGAPLPLGLMQVKELYDRREAVFVDARDDRAYSAGHIVGALSIPIGKAAAEKKQLRDRLPLATPIIVYCNGYDCHDSRALGEMLIGWGYGTVYVFEGGYPAWRDAGYPTGGGTR